MSPTPTLSLSHVISLFCLHVCMFICVGLLILSLLMFSDCGLLCTLSLSLQAMCLCSHSDSPFLWVRPIFYSMLPLSLSTYASTLLVFSFFLFPHPVCVCMCVRVIVFKALVKTCLNLLLQTCDWTTGRRAIFFLFSGLTSLVPPVQGDGVIWWLSHLRGEIQRHLYCSPCQSQRATWC